MKKPTSTERMTALGAFDGDWPEGSMFAPPGMGFARTGDLRSRLHLARYDESTTALCGVYVGTDRSEQTLIRLIERESCPRCLAVAEKERQS